jgi:dTDP-4-dehydrorhamnose reductase
MTLALVACSAGLIGSEEAHYEVDIRDRDTLAKIFARYGPDIAVAFHTSAQPSHDWAARDPFTDLDINAAGHAQHPAERPRALHRRTDDPLLHQQGVRASRHGSGAA